MSELKSLEGYQLADIVARQNIEDLRSRLNDVTGGTAVPDKTLTEEGTAADAKVVGDLFEAFDDRLTVLEDASDSGNIATDTTLKTAGVAADAKAAGDAIQSLQTQINDTAEEREHNGTGGTHHSI